MEKETEYDDETFSEPMVWIGIYIAIASFFCILAMAADLLHGLENKKLWFPCKYFSLNAASITVIAIAMKLTVDLTTVMPTDMDQVTKLGCLSFMCTMMANLMPSLASMDNKTLLANMIGLCILVVTMIVNIFIQITTEIIDYIPFYYGDVRNFDSIMVAYIYMAMIILLLILMISSSLIIPTSKEILDSKYQAINKISLIDQNLQHIQMPIVEKLRQHVRRYWVMAETGSPQFVMVSNPLSTASGIICVLNLLMNLFFVLEILHDIMWEPIAYQSPYKWSTIVILITQSVGVAVGSIAPISRCFSVSNFKLATKCNRNHSKFLKVERYWTQKLHEWKQSPISFLSSSRRSRSLIYTSKNTTLSLCIGFQKVIIVSCKVISLITIIIPIFVINRLYCLKSLKNTNDIDEDLRSYVLQIDDEMELVGKMISNISISMNVFVLKAMMEQNNNLLELLKNSTGFKGVEIFDTDQVHPLLSIELVNSWSLPIVTLTCIAIALPNIPKDTIENLFTSVTEGLWYTHLVEESLNVSSEYANLRMASLTIWHEVENKCTWFDNPLARNVFEGETTTKILKWFSNKAKEIVREFNVRTNRELVENPPKALIAANSMYRITQTILLKYQGNLQPVTENQLFAHLNSMIADIFSACFTNIPRVIRMRCHESVIEKREASVKVATKLLGKITRIIEILETREVPSMNDDKKAYIDEWRLYMKQYVP